MNRPAVFVEPPDPPGFVAFRHSHAGFGEFCRESRLRLPTLDVFLCASALLERGFAAGVVDSALMGHGPDECVREVLGRGPSFVAVRAGLFSLERDLDVARRIREGFGGPVVLFGPAASARRAEVLASGAVDGVPSGWAPAAFLELAAGGRGALRRGAWRRAPGGGNVLESGPGEEDLAGMPVPRWDLVPYGRYSFVTAQTGWGCRGRCGYCPYPVTQGGRPAFRPVEDVVSEFKALRSRYGLRFALLRDPDFCQARGRAVELCGALASAGTPIAWGCEARLESIDGDLASRLASAGCLRVAFGVESLAPEVLRRMGRRAMRPGEVRARVAMLKRRGILAYAMYLIGLPGETRRSTLDLIEFALGLGTEAASFAMPAPFPGTALARLAPGCRAPTGCLPSLRNERMSEDEIEELYLLARRKWKERGRAPASKPAVPA